MTTDKMPCHITDGPPSDDPRDDDWTLPEGKGNYADGSQELYDSWDDDQELIDALNDIASTQIDEHFNEKDKDNGYIQDCT